ncbi:c-type cytochrome [Gloeobacter violaceus]|uniref:Cytochrome c6 n=1 Tax=Gloeobacter violaceus (strain ATCC 29082 / PCC 7421) TaxID=251221 RepID=Q7NJC6_GLOVI|nr:c-type cytochrome [Gloeobacter violaceus]BAC89847.1 cytochrome c553 [Gloeobacter violaceus PCC 7421]
MRWVWTVGAVSISVLGAGVILAEAQPDLAAGEKIFKANCAACHAGGNNIVEPEKTLKKEALAHFGMGSPAAIIQQVTGGKNAMPAFGGELSTEEIRQVASYVLEMADKDWQK